MEGIDRYHWNLARIFFGMSSIWAILGISCNSLILLITIKTRSMRSTYNFLIALCAVGDIFHQVGNLVQIPLLFDVHLEIDSDLCNLIMFLPSMGIAIGCTCVLCVGLDRMFSVLSSFRYRSLNKRHYHGFLASLIVGYCAYFIILMFCFHHKRIVDCEILTPYPDTGFVWFGAGNLTVNLMSGIVYFVIWLRLRARVDPVLMRRIVKSLFIIVSMDITGWFLTPGLILFFNFLRFNPQQMFAGTYFNAMFIHISLSVKFFIYYSASIEYRYAINAFFYKHTKAWLKSQVSDSSKLFHSSISKL